MSDQALNDDHTDPQTNEGNLLSLITLKQILGKEGQTDKVLAAMAKEETRHLMMAMRILSSNGDNGLITGDAPIAAAAKLQDKFGRDMSAALRLGKLLKNKADSKEVELMLNPFVLDTINNKGESRNTRSGFKRTAAGPTADISAGVPDLWSK